MQKIETCRPLDLISFGRHNYVHGVKDDVSVSIHLVTQQGNGYI